MRDSLLNKSSSSFSDIEANHIAGSILRSYPSLSSEQSNYVVTTLFDADSELSSIAVTQKRKPIGLIGRNYYMEKMAKPYSHSLFDRKSCITFMDESPLIVDQNMGMQELISKALGYSRKSLSNGFILTDENGDYVGIGSGEDLIKAIAFLQAEKNRLTTESINYASVIQRSFLHASKEAMSSLLLESFLVWEPRDKVGGDYFFCKKFNDGFFFALIDCTGHGVPGAFMTLIASSFLDTIVIDDNCRDPAITLSILNKKIKNALRQTSEHKLDHEGQSDDGMDAAFCWVENDTLIYAGAKTPLFFKGNDDVNQLEAGRKGLGYIDTPIDYEWKNQKLFLEKGMCIYLTTDGIIDQVGGPNNISFGKKRFSAVIQDNYLKPMSEQEDVIMQAFNDYQGAQRRRDDVSMVGFRF